VSAVSGARAATESRSLHLQPLELWFLPTAGPLLPQVQAALAAEARRQGGSADMVAEPLRWGITAVEAGRGLRLEGVMVLSPALSAGPLSAAAGG
jgi:hypothetical protein